MKQRITWIIPADLDNIVKSCKRDKAGNLIVPETIELYVKPSRVEQLKIEIQRLEKELEGMKEPTERDLIEEGMMMHPYYQILEQLEHYKSEL